MSFLCVFAVQPFANDVNEIEYRSDGVKRSETTYHRYMGIIVRPNGTTTRRLMTDMEERTYRGSLVRTSSGGRRLYNERGFVDIIATASGDSIARRYYVKDYLGNIRAVVDADGTLLQATDYLAFGLPATILSQPAVDNRLYEGNEFQNFRGLGWTDNAARFHDTLFPRFTTVDPLAEKDPGTSPYAYCGNNPLRFIDPTGMYLLVTGSAKDEAVSQLQSYVSKGVKLEIGKSGIVSFKSSVKPTNDDIKLLNVLNDPDILVELNTTTDYNTENGKLFVGGAFMGNEVVDNPNSKIKVVTHQTVNPNVLGLADSVDDKPGTMIMHEVTESYEGGKIAMEKGQSTPPAKKEYLEDPNSVYNQAHKRATRQLNVSPVYYDKNENITPNKKEAKRVEWVAKGSKGSVVIQEMH